MDYGKKILGKLGWKEGEGLGKNKAGLVKPIKANLKFDNLGFGANLAETDFNNHWWERVYQEASGNLDIQRDKNGTIGMNLKNEDNEVEIVTRSYSIKKLKKSKHSTNKTIDYDNFLKSSTLSNGYKEVEDGNKVSVEDITFINCHPLSDDELFRACGGRTAHKGARHGLKLSGKLSRIEKQDQELLKRMQPKNNSVEKSEATESDLVCATSRKKRDLQNNTDTILSHKRQKKAKRNEQCDGSESSKKKNRKAH